MDTYCVDQEFVCKVCGDHIVSGFDEQPVCCEQAMIRGQLFPAENNQVMRLHMIVADEPNMSGLYRKPQYDWSLPGKPDKVFELWRLAPGRANGERIGWIGQRTTCIEWIMPTGVKIKNGTATTVEEAAEMMLVAIDGGVHAKRVIAEISS